MVLDSEPKPVGREISVRIPSPDAGPFAGQIAPPPAPKDGKAAAKGSESAAPAATGKASAAAPQEAPKETAPAAEKPAKAAPRKEPAKPKPKPKPAKAAEGQFVVQVIALADANKARQMQERIADAGIKSFTEIVKTAKGDVTRVRAGPFATRDAAEKAREQLKTLGMSGNITNR
jgi:DedD protein